MSAYKRRAKTLQEKLGFKDDDLGTPAHDAIMFWLDANMHQIVSKLFPNNWDLENIRNLEKKSKAEQLETKKKLETQTAGEKTEIEELKTGSRPRKNVTTQPIDILPGRPIQVLVFSANLVA